MKVVCNKSTQSINSARVARRQASSWLPSHYSFFASARAQGIYYTPTYIVDYIVRNTLGKLLAERNISIERIKVLDAACGSGSFLIKTFDVLNEHCQQIDKDYSQTKLDFIRQFLALGRH
ncbi:MAG TPA: N-6 DNA methylase [Candidatus Bathyarchaeia archaeon]|nr:N-6 DNA methylase [Candidatus Bathyarchaeia archaeon]